MLETRLDRSHDQINRLHGSNKYAVEYDHSRNSEVGRFVKLPL